MARLFNREVRALVADPAAPPEQGARLLPDEVPPPAKSDAPPTPETGSGKLLGTILVEQGVITQEQLEAGLEKAAANDLRLGEALVAIGALDERGLTDILADQFGIGVADLSRFKPDPEVASRLPEATARRFNAVPLHEVDGVVEVVVGDLRPGLEKELSSVIGSPVRLLAVAPSMARQTIDRAYRVLGDVEGMITAFTTVDVPRISLTDHDEEITADSPVARVVNTIITQALRDRASDIHLEPSSDSMRVRYRIDGALNQMLNLPMTIASPLISRIKILGGMNIVERRKAQDGQFAMTIDERDIDVRVSTMATVWGEKCVMRILDKSRSLIRLHQLGMPLDTHEMYSRMVHSPFGMVLCAGPTGSGKTTTLYATMTEINEESRNIVTIEDPVEYVFPSINQIQTNDAAGVTFADGLKAILRQDPDVILVGEIRNQETARIAVQAALTGHFVMSSLHATDSVAALHRFLDMGIEAFLVSSSILGIVSQRLVRRMCQSCAEPYTPTDEEMSFYQEGGGVPKDVFLHGVGCNLCSGTGYQDRIGVYEFLRMTPEIRRLLVGWATQDELRRVAINQGMRTLRTEGLTLVDRDITTIPEVIRSIYAI